MSKRRQFFKFVARAMILGTVVGALSSLPFLASTWEYVSAVILLTILYGAFIGMVNGIILGWLAFYHPADNDKVHRRRMVFTSVAISIVGTFLFFILAAYPIITFPTPSGKPLGLIPVLGFGICLMPHAIVSAFITSFATRRIKYQTAP